MADKLKISQMIQQRIREKKELELANQPKVPVLKVMFENADRAHEELSERRDILKRELEYQKNMLKMKAGAVKEVSQSLRQPHSKIKIEPDFFASQAIPLNIKDFYRKSSNTFMKMAMLQKIALSKFVDQRNKIGDCLKRIRELQQILRNNNISYRKQKSDQLVANMTQKLKSEQALQKGFQLKDAIQELHRKHSTISKQYEFKKERLQKMQGEIIKLADTIEYQSKRYNDTYNIVTYRQYLQKIFSAKLKIQCLESNVRKSHADVTNLLSQTTKLQDSLIHTNNFTRYGHMQTMKRKIKHSQKRHQSVTNRSRLNNSEICQKSFLSHLNTTNFKTDRSPSPRRKQWSTIL